jgi:predicted AAA+ superfamily ATPase
MPAPFQRAFVAQLSGRLAEPRRSIQLLTGPRQVGKTTGVLQALKGWAAGSTHFVSADSASPADEAWLRAQWAKARELSAAKPAVLVLDEIQRVPRWSSLVKGLWDEDSRHERPLHAVLLGSSALLLQKGLTESLAGRFETLPVAHWSLPEEAKAFHWDLEQHLHFGGYPGLSHLIQDPERWRLQVRSGLIAPAIQRDVLAMARIDKPALLERLFTAACHHAAQVVSYNKLLGQLTDQGNSAILAHYQALLERAWLILGLQKYSGSTERSRASSPKWLPLAPALVTATNDRDWSEWSRPGEARGQLVEAAVGAHLARQCRQHGWWLGYWADGNAEVDYVVKAQGRVWAIEVKSGRARNTRSLGLFLKKYPKATPLIVEGEGGGLKKFLTGELEK